MFSCTIIGLTDTFPPHLNKWARRKIKRATVFSGGRRHHLLVKGMLPDGYRWIDVVPPLDDVFKQYEEVDHLVVFASGDPLFYGFASTVMTRCPECSVKVYPRFNSLQMLAHAICLPYHDMRTVSLTGRDWSAFDEALIRGEKLIGILTDKVKTPHAIRERMVEYGYGNYTLYVGERLGSDFERTGEYDPTFTYADPNCVIAKRTEMRQHPFGIPDEAFNQLEERPNMITKMPVRLAALSALGLADKHTLWDIGFCTGSVSIEAKLQFPHLNVVAFERREECADLMEMNASKFGTPGISMVIRDFMQTDTSELPRPDAVFIGGHGGHLGNMMERLQGIMDGGCIVFNSVTPESMQEFLYTADRLNMHSSAVHTIKVDSHNPITIMKAEW